MTLWPLDFAQPKAYPLPDGYVLQLQGEDRLRFLHNQTTNAIQGRSPGDWVETIFVTSTGRTLDLVTVWVGEDFLWIQGRGSQRQFLLDWMDRYIFPFDKVSLSDVTQTYGAVILLGDPSGLGLDRPEPGQWLTQLWHGVPLHILPNTGLDLPGYTILYSPALSEDMAPWRSLPVLTPDQWETLRIHQGRPQAGSELTEDYNPLEAGLWRAIAFDKGCYIGQETIARLNTYKGVKQRLWGLDFKEPVAPGTRLTLPTDPDKTIGVVTSVAPLTHQGLGYLKTKAVEPGQPVQAGTAIATVIPTPYLRHTYPLES